MDATTDRLPAFKKVHCTLYAKRFRSTDPQTGYVHEIAKPKGEAFLCLLVDGKPMSWTRDNKMSPTLNERAGVEARLSTGFSCAPNIQPEDLAVPRRLASGGLLRFY